MPNALLTQYPTMKEVLWNDYDLAATTPVTIAQDAALGLLVPGTVIGLLSGGKGRRLSSAPVKTAAAFSTAAATGGVVGASTIFKAGDVLVKRSDASAIGTILSISGDTITLTGNAAQNVAAGVEIMSTVGGVGAPTAAGILVENVDATLGDVVASLYITGLFDAAQLVGMTAGAMVDLGATYRLGTSIVRM
jgi:hypothetical protein